MSLNGYALPQDWLNILVFIHVISAVTGIGPVFFGHVLTRKGQTLSQLRSSISMGKMLEMFPKILGSLAVVTGLLLAWLGDYGFAQFWIYGAITLYVIIQVVVIGFMAPAMKNLAAKIFASTEPAEQPVNPEFEASVSKINGIQWIASVLGILLFAFMFFKPTL